ncbi:DNA-processing protein DprA [Amycolatopsis pigmentata]|uniref:DNA-processing protein DprA n=1 Tax=Amycolatopsis pigmentata TaxID=450801 RepID=A0ABW5FTU5_9PSEU
MMRNATMSGYGVATVVVEAGEISGTRAQARLAVEHGRAVILTESVVEQNSWAKAMLPRPGVYCACSLKDIVDIVRSVTAERPSSAGSLEKLLPAV